MAWASTVASDGDILRERETKKIASGVVNGEPLNKEEIVMRKKRGNILWFFGVMVVCVTLLICFASTSTLYFSLEIFIIDSITFSLG